MRMKPLWAALLALGITGAHAADLLQAWQAARQHDPEMAVAQAAQQAGQTRRDQASALWRPTVAATVAGGAMGSQTSTGGASFSAPGFGTSPNVGFNTSVDNSLGGRWSIGARMPVYSPERTAQGRKLTLSADLADVQWQAAEQALMLQTAERYFAVALAQDALRLLQRQQTAVNKALVEAKDRFALGDAPVTDTHEAAAVPAPSMRRCWQPKWICRLPSAPWPTPPAGRPMRCRWRRPLPCWQLPPCLPCPSGWTRRQRPTPACASKPWPWRWRARTSPNMPAGQAPRWTWLHRPAAST
ncbi:TolC family protein [Acidovorax carolinensis]|uniref:TolC family protein n=1 Tax=Acidovorax carolinensis TaxID=553814 RepID=UPI001F00E324|nr:TolC family protein [Acidovorax carolinensis]